MTKAYMIKNMKENYKNQKVDINKYNKKCS